MVRRRSQKERREAEQIAIFAREAGFEVVYQEIRPAPDEIVSSAEQEGVT